MSDDRRPMTGDRPTQTIYLHRPLVSIVLVTYNSAAHLPAFFAALAAMEYDENEVIVVDNASQDDTLRMLNDYHNDITLLANSENIGFGRACNQGARRARGELLVFMNPDVIVTSSWLTLLVQHLVEQPDAAIICPTTESGVRGQGSGLGSC